MTDKEAIENLREFCKLKPFCELYPEECRENECEIYLAIKALEKQLPKKPKHVITNMGINGNFRRECPSCGWLMFERVTTKDASEPVVCRIFNFCQSCGQRIDWGKE